jgi:DNA primase
MNWRLGVGGGGAIDLAMHLYGLDFRSAVAWLAGWVGVAASPVRPGPARECEFRLPSADARRLGQVRGYLVEERGLAGSGIDARVAAGDLYADARGNAVFLLRDARGRPVGAELRGTSSRRWRGMAAGSRKDLGCYSVPADGARVAILCESAIDALSCAQMWPDRLCVSTSGARARPGWLADLLARGLHVHCGFDADAAGDEMATALIALHPTVTRLRPTRHDWNDVLRAR